MRYRGKRPFKIGTILRLVKMGIACDTAHVFLILPGEPVAVETGDGQAQAAVRTCNGFLLALLHEDKMLEHGIEAARLSNMERFYFKRRAKSRFDTWDIPINEEKVLFVPGNADGAIFLAISNKRCIEFPEVSSFLV
jgi:hypothetical protein